MSITFDPDYVPLTNEQRLLNLKKQRDELELEFASRPEEHAIRNRRVRFEYERRMELLNRQIAMLEGTIQGCIQRNIARQPRRVRRLGC